MDALPLIRGPLHCAARLAVVVWIGFATAGSLARAADSQVLAEQSRRIAVIERMAPAVVAIFSPDGNGGGSGVIVSPDGFVVTNYRVDAETLQSRGEDQE